MTKQEQLAELMRRGELVRIVFQRWDLIAYAHISPDKMTDSETMIDVGKQAELAFINEITRRYEDLTEEESDDRLSGEENSPD